VKKVLASFAVFACVLTLAAAPATPEPLAVVRVADPGRLTQAVLTFASSTELQSLGATAAGAMSQMPFFTHAGALRSGQPIVVALFGPLRAESDDDCRFVTVYAPEGGKEAVLSHWENPVQTNGVYYGGGERPFVASFSADGTRVAVSDDPSLLAPSLAASLSARPLPAGIVAETDLLLRAIEKIATANASNDVASVMARDFLKQVKSASFSLGVSDRGLDMRGSFAFDPTSSFARAAGKRLPLDALSSAGSNTVYVSAQAFGSCADADELEKLLAFFAKRGIDTSFVSVRKTNLSSRVSLDLSAALAYVNGEAKKTFSTLDPYAFMADLRAFAAAKNDGSFSFDGPGGVQTFELKDVPMGATAEERFRRTMPERSIGSCNAVSVVSVYAFLRAVTPLVAEIAVPEMAPMLTSSLSFLPPSGDGAIASASWSEGDSFEWHLRLSYEELKGLFSAARVAMLVCPFSFGDED
jgi:hypothetical protein